MSRLLFYASEGDPPNLLLNKRYVIYVLAVIQIWRSMGYSLIIYLAALQNIPPELYESAEVDGARPLQNFEYYMANANANHILPYHH